MEAGQQTGTGIDFMRLDRNQLMSELELAIRLNDIRTLTELRNYLDMMISADDASEHMDQVNHYIYLKDKCDEALSKLEMTIYG